VSDSREGVRLRLPMQLSRRSPGSNQPLRVPIPYSYEFPVQIPSSTHEQLPYRTLETYKYKTMPNTVVARQHTQEREREMACNAERLMVLPFPLHLLTRRDRSTRPGMRVCNSATLSTRAAPVTQSRRSTNELSRHGRAVSLTSTQRRPLPIRLPRRHRP
jgi:hypothetical protein